MPSIKCPDCGLVNFAAAEVCKRCGAPIGQGPAPTRPSAGRHHDNDGDSDFLPRRDGKFLVVTEETVLPDRCVRCNAWAAKTVKRRLECTKVRLSWATLLTWLLGFIVFRVRSQRATIYIGLCNRHYNRRLAGMMFSGGLILFGILGAVAVTLNGDSDVAPLIILPTVFPGALLLVWFRRTVTAKRIAWPYVWVKGVHRDFLNSL